MLKGVVIAALAISVLLSFRSFAQQGAAKPPPVDRKITLKFKDAMVKNEDVFKSKLARLDARQYQVRLKHSDASKPDEELPAGSSSKAEIKTEKVTESAIAKSYSSEELVVIGPHVTQAITSVDKAEIQSILDELQ
jgi:hypothetical protein